MFIEFIPVFIISKQNYGVKKHYTNFLCVKKIQVYVKLTTNLLVSSPILPYLQLPHYFQLHPGSHSPMDPTATERGGELWV